MLKSYWSSDARRKVCTIPCLLFNLSVSNDKKCLFCQPLHADGIIEMLYSDSLSDVPNDDKLGLCDNDISNKRKHPHVLDIPYLVIQNLPLK